MKILGFSKSNLFLKVQAERQPFLLQLESVPTRLAEHSQEDAAATLWQQLLRCVSVHQQDLGTNH